MNDPRELTTERLEAEITTLAAHIAAATCRWLELVEEFDARKGYEKWECISTAHWLNWHCSLDLRAAKEKVRVARALPDLPVIRAAFSKGELSYSKVRAITRVATRENEEDLVMYAGSTTASQLERIVGSMRRAEGVQGNGAAVERYCTWRTEEDGSVVLTAKLPAEDAAVVLNALNKAQDEMRSQAREQRQVSGAEGCSAEHPSTQADALVAIAETALAQEVQPANERYQVVLHVEASELGNDSGVAAAESGFSLDAKTARRIACDASIVTQIEKEGEVLSVGRKTRVIPTSMRRALRARDRGCRFPGCTATRFVDQHHIQHWAHGGETALSNLVQLCRRHHRACHEHDISIALDGSAARFIRKDGSEIRVLSAQGSVEKLLDSGPSDVSAEALLPKHWDGKGVSHWAMDCIVGNHIDQLEKLKTPV